MSASFTNLTAALSAAPQPTEPGWLSDLRSAAVREVKERGLPTRKAEAWRFTPLQSLESPTFDVSQSAPKPATEPEPGRVILVNDGHALWGALPKGVRVRRLSEVLRSEPESVEGRLGALAPQRDFSALNAALFTDGIVIDVAPGTRLNEAIWLDHHAWAEQATVTYPRVLIRVGEGAECTLVERFVGEPASQHLRDEVSEIDVCQNAQFRQVRIHHGHPNRSHLTELAVSVAQDAAYSLSSIVFGGALVRLSINVGLHGRGAEAKLNGVFLAQDGDVIDHHTQVEHHEGHCHSEQSFRGVLSGRGHAVFDGVIVVHRDAQRTDAHMQNRNLLLSDAATIHTKPHLEIDADDVKCSHGATIGALDDDQLFYLRARGIPEELAKAMLTYAFIRENLESLGAGELLDDVSTAVLKWLPNGDRLRETLA